MRLFKFRIKNYRSFIDTGDIQLSKDQNLIPIIGENNIGKTNLVSAICLGLTAIKSTYHYSILDKQRVKKLDRRSFPYARVKYLFERDYPVTLQKGGTEPTLIELWFETNGRVTGTAYSRKNDECTCKIKNISLNLQRTLVMCPQR
mgnify:CR=1 FL=1